MNTATTSRIETNNDYPVEIEFDEPHGYKTAKRAIDIVLSILLLITLLPLFIIVAVAIVVEDKGPILYFQQRTGKHGKPFKFYKFRTMRRNADDIKRQLGGDNEATGPIFKMKNDPRVTKVGKILRRLSIDETPQLINVLQGKMSIVGPRPLPVLEAYGCNPRQWQRHSINPGLLCYREISGRSSLTFERWMELDLDYVSHHNMLIDFKIMAKAVPAVIRGDGAY
jgi:lipopolysaccharide/colanic/teichoic acid biosynthesis glycosyltransferase